MKLSVASTSFFSALLATTIIGTSSVPTTMADDSITRILLDSTLTFDGSGSITGLTDSEVLFVEDVYKSAFNVISGGDAGTGTVRSSIVTDHTVTNKARRRRGLRKGATDDDGSDNRDLSETLEVPYFFFFLRTDFSCRFCNPDEDTETFVLLDPNSRKLRILNEESDMDKFNKLVCEMFNDSPIAALQGASNCDVQFITA